MNKKEPKILIKKVVDITEGNPNFLVFFVLYVIENIHCLEIKELYFLEH